MEVVDFNESDIRDIETLGKSKAFQTYVDFVRKHVSPIYWRKLNHTIVDETDKTNHNVSAGTIAGIELALTYTDEARDLFENIVAEEDAERKQAELDAELKGEDDDG